MWPSRNANIDTGNVTSGASVRLFMTVFILSSYWRQMFYRWLTLKGGIHDSKMTNKWPLVRIHKHGILNIWKELQHSLRWNYGVLIAAVASCSLPCKRRTKKWPGQLLVSLLLDKCWVYLTVLLSDWGQWREHVVVLLLVQQRQVKEHLLCYRKMVSGTGSGVEVAI